MKKKVLSANKAKFLSSFCVAVITVIVVNVLAQIVFSNFKTKMYKQYKENCLALTEGYSQSINFNLKNYYNRLDYVADKVDFTKLSENQIADYIFSLKDKKDRIFNNIFFADSNGHAFTQNNAVFNIKNREYFEKGKTFTGNYIVSDPVESNINSEYVVVVGKRIVNGDGSFKGLLCCSISLKNIEEIFADLRLIDDTKITLLDSKGRFMVNAYHPDMIMHTYTPSDSDLKKYSTEQVARMKNGACQTIWETGDTLEKVDLFFRSVEDTPWVFETIIPHERYESIGWMTRISGWILFGIIMVMAVIVLICENLLFDHFQKRKTLAGYYDSLTNLWTRQKFEKECSILLENNRDQNFLLIEADIRGFKFINQNYGGDAADKLLYFFSENLNILAKKYKGMIGRGYADHFYLFFKIHSREYAMPLLKSSIEEVNRIIKSYELPFSPKIGLAFYEGAKDSETIQGMIGKASFARSTIKDNAMVQFAIYDEQLLKIVNEERFLEQHMEQALEDEEFFVMYQPKIDLKTDKVVGAEALVRWNNPKLGVLPPAKFIPLFERNRFVKKLDFYVYNSVFKFIQKQLQLKHKIVPISVNMSRIHTSPEQFINEFMASFEKYNVDPKYVEVEILERSVVGDDTLLEITNLLHKKGFKVAMDDFGAGESSLNMLTKIPVDILKFDREFLLDSTDETGAVDEKNQKFIKTLVDLSKNLEKQTIFEGVETVTQRDFLKRIDCDQVQGYLYSKPLMEEDFLQFLKIHG